MKRVVYAQNGNPHEVLQVEETELETPGKGEVLVGRILAPINPADLNAVEGNYPSRATLPAVPGVEGVGFVEAVGEGVTELKPGMRVVFPHGYGTWREAGVIAASELIPVPEGVPLREAAMIKINPATAWRMLHDFVDLEPGSWVVQNAANSAVGRNVIAFAKELGIRTINLVRRPELIEELTKEGGDLVLLDDENAAAKIKELTQRAPIHLALNAVGGESATRMAAVLANGGSLVTYGAMSRQAFKLPAGFLIFKNLHFHGFWVSHWYETADPADRLAMFTRLFELAARGVIKTPVERVYPVADVLEAVARASEGRREGKILLGVE